MPCDKNDWTSNIVCNFYHRPRVAVALGGAARNLAQPLLYRSIRTNLIEAFGGDTTVFAVLKLEDKRGAGASEGLNMMMNAEEANIRHALEFIGVKSDRHVILSNTSDLPNSRSPICGTPWYVTPGRPSDLYNSLIGQLNIRQHVHQLIEAEESRTGLPFEFVIFARPDVSWPYPVKPFCFWCLECAHRKSDWVLMASREKARVNLDVIANDLWNCNPMVAQNEWNPIDGIIAPELYIFRHFEGDGHITEQDWTLRQWMPGHITRQQQDNMPLDLCDDILWPRQGDVAQCQQMTWKNPCDNLPADSCAVTGECPIASADPVLCGEDELTANIACQFYSRPRVAVALGGAARNLAQPLLYRSIRTNLVEAFGGDTTVFAILKLEDQRGAGASEGLDFLKDAEEANIRHALEFIGVKSDRHVILSNGTQLPNSRSPICGTPWYVTPGRPSDLYNSLLGQLNTRQQLYHLIEAEESRTGLAFDFIIYTRPDVSWPYPVKPFCFWDLNWTYRKLDWVLFASREAARVNLDQPANDLWNCDPMIPRNEEYPPDGIQAPEHYMFRHFVGTDEFDAFVTKEISGFITRQNVPNRAIDLCDTWNSNYIILWSEGDQRRCEELTWRNTCGNLPSASCAVTGEC